MPKTTNIAPASETLDYQQVLARVEAFLEDTGLRDFCSNACHVHCCGNCYKLPTACRRNEGRRLMCSLYFCEDLFYVFARSEASWTHSPEQSAWIYLRRAALDQLSRLLRNDNPYFTVNSPELVKNFRLSAEIVSRATSPAAKQLVADNLLRNRDVYVQRVNRQSS